MLGLASRIDKYASAVRKKGSLFSTAPAIVLGERIAFKS
ncbi:hypothetical protein ADIARSV_1945 [Arcticibacter svalbardensis MN12-7]|uniref:Uncharacterized protein n=1 Tax=Arcticibacter svalbardensis MN12-7 TaxID=1150600 RepID=R9GT64_9SPHI|nr:hypothetical protein ADIARSV_1945 [Arcticibacter svalbardensis MN12-7]